jgi:hypothetical protein
MTDDWDREKLSGMLADIRETELPGRRGGTSHYARTVRACFEEIQCLIAEGFTMFTICKFLEKRDALPPGADTRSFCRAYNRERLRRERSAKPKRTRAKEASAKNENAAKPAVASEREKEPCPPSQQYQTSVKPRDGLRVNPDNTFVIQPIDPDDLPDYESLTKRRSEI